MLHYIASLLGYEIFLKLKCNFLKVSPEHAALAVVLGALSRYRHKGMVCPPVTRQPYIEMAVAETKFAQLVFNNFIQTLATPLSYNKFSKECDHTKHNTKQYTYTINIANLINNMSIKYNNY